MPGWHVQYFVYHFNVSFKNVEQVIAVIIVHYFVPVISYPSFTGTHASETMSQDNSGK
jgi:hypothetical protein